jgi:hypothetical protein
MSLSPIQQCPSGPSEPNGRSGDFSPRSLSPSQSVASKLLNSVPPKEDSLQVQIKRKADPYLTPSEVAKRQKAETVQKRPASPENSLQVPIKRKADPDLTPSEVAKRQKAETVQKRPASSENSLQFPIKQKEYPYLTPSEVAKRQKIAESKRLDLKSEGRSLEPDLKKMIERIFSDMAFVGRDQDSLEEINKVRKEIKKNYNEKDYFDMKQIVAKIEKLKMQLS